MTDLIEEAGAPPSRARVARSVGIFVHMKRSGARRWIDEIVMVSIPDAAGEFEEALIYERRLHRSHHATQPASRRRSRRHP